eukprot:323930-Rhodomonas_salina.2
MDILEMREEIMTDQVSHSSTIETEKQPATMMLACNTFPPFLLELELTAAIVVVVPSALSQSSRRLPSSRTSSSLPPRSRPSALSTLARSPWIRPEPEARRRRLCESQLCSDAPKFSNATYRPGCLGQFLASLSCSTVLDSDT